MLITNNYHYECLLAFLNSGVFEWYLSIITGNLGGNAKIGQKSNFLKMHLPILPEKEQEEFKELVKNLISTRSTIYYQEQIEKKIYSIIRLNYEEINFIRTQCSQ